TKQRGQLGPQWSEQRGRVEVGYGLEVRHRWTTRGCSDARRIPERLVELHCSLHELTGPSGDHFLAVTQLDAPHLVLATWLQARIDLAQPLPPPEAKQDALFLRANQQGRTVRK